MIILMININIYFKLRNSLIEYTKYNLYSNILLLRIK